MTDHLDAIDKRLAALYGKIDDARLADAEATVKALRARRAADRAEQARQKAHETFMGLCDEHRALCEERDRLLSEEARRPLPSLEVQNECDHPFSV